ncbi:MFS family permease [Variovorax sp. TBS-050B]|uniref:MFS transporter n=1 Tax=Variovorax sp. TBS-050B TaxID=2940551 RepID=UPI002476E4EF|nr:MFS transporter [Variovorax sp. TBS-050B]MDH6590451.1 MFS family permease [Variovorax sp. TBS-050B]
MTTKKTDPAARAALFQDRNFRWLMTGSAISLMGDQFTLLALPWLVLRLTGDTVALGTVLALVGIPRAVFILVGGAVVDRFSPQRVLMLTKHVNLVLLALLALGVWQGALTLPAIYALSLALGISSAFSIPSGTSILPHALAPAQLGAANSVMMGLRQLSMFLGPLAAGVLIALFGDGSGGAQDAGGIAAALALDALSFGLSAWTLAQVKLRALPADPARHAPIWTSVVSGVRHVWDDAQLRTLYIYWGAVAVLVLGPLHIALPVLAESRPGLGAQALGLMVGAHGAGTLLGMVISGLRPGLRIGTLGTSVLLADIVIGLLFVPLGGITAAWQGALLMVLVGVLGGFMQVSVFTWVQKRVPPAMLGRSMSLFMFIFMGLLPVASAAAGWLLQVVSLPQLFAGAGLLLVAAAVLAWVGTAIRGVDDAVVGGSLVGRE